MMPIRVRATFNWRKDDGDFVDQLVEDLWDVASAVVHRAGEPLLPAGVQCVPAKAGHFIELRMAPTNTEACLELLGGVAEAGAELTMILRPCEETI